jgi:hypothetical protein
MKEKNQKLRAKLWPGITDRQLLNRLERHGFATIPRTMPLLMSMMDGMSKNKPVSAVYLEIWCRANEEGFAILKHDDMAFHAGFSGERAIRTWKDRLRVLHELGFIDLKPGASGPESYALVWNPYHVVEQHRRARAPGLTEMRYNALVARMSEIGATDLDEETSAAIESEFEIITT